MVFNFYATIKIRINKACDAIYNSWYKFFLQTTNIYKVFFHRLQKL